MTLNEAIQHLEETIADPTHKWGCEECKAEHVQLLMWLEEYEKLKSDYSELLEEYDEHRRETRKLKADYIDLDKQMRDAKSIVDARWIRMDKRLPEQGQEFLICSTNSNIISMRCRPWGDDSEQMRLYKELQKTDDKCGLYWMPIPEPPEGGTK